MRKCNTKVPKKLSNKVCVRKKSMGGHKNTFINDYSSGGVHCGKLINHREYDFFVDINNTRDPILKFMPKFYGSCEYQGREYIVFENLFNSLKSNIKFIDLKIGHKTAYYPDSDYIKSIRHGIMDRYLSTTKEYGYRVEGINFNVGGRKITSKHARHNIKNDELWDSFFGGNRSLRNKIIRKLRELLVILEDNVKRRGNRFGFIGSSILMAHDGTRVVLKIIDFAHSYYDRSSFTKELAIDFYDSVYNLLDSILLNSQ